MEKIQFQTENEETAELFVLEETRLNGVNYLLVTDSDSEEDEAECYIFKEVSKTEQEEVVYEPVDDEDELKNLSGIFKELMEDVEFIC